MKKILPALIFFSLAIAGKAQITYQITYSDVGHCDAKSVIQTSDGSYVFAGSEVVPGHASDIILVKTDSVGTTIWSAVYSSTRGNDTLINDYGYDVKETSDGYIICGTTFGSPLDASFSDVLLIKTDFSGSIQWANVYGGGGNDDAFSISLSNENGYYITGHADDNGSSNNKGFILKIDESGNPVWYRFANVAGNSRFNNGTVASDSGFVATGSIAYPGSVNDLFLVKCSKTGNLEWAHRYSAPGDQQGNSVVETSNGNYMVAGSTSVNGSVNLTDMLIVESNSSGAFQWAKTYNHLFEDRATGIVRADNSTFGISGYSNGTSVIDTVRLADFLKIDSTGSILNSAMFGDFTRDCFGYNILHTSDNGFIIGGVSNGLAGPDGAAYIIKTDATGGSAECQANDLSLSSAPLAMNDSAGCDTTSMFPIYDVTSSTIPFSISSISFGVVCIDTSSVQENNETLHISVYPNPVNSELNIDLETAKKHFDQLTVSDEYGRVIMTRKIAPNDTKVLLSVKSFKPGIYVLELRGDDNLTVKKFVRINGQN